MATTDRPSGLTALALINFILAFFQIVRIPDFLIERYVQSQGRRGKGSPIEEAAEAVMADLGNVPLWTVILLCSLLAVSGLLLLVTGIGYWKRKRFWGRRLTTVYVATDLAYVVCVCALLPESYLRGLGISLIRTAFYPLFLGTVIHTVFRRDLVR
jgi:hypothetical protein